MAPKLDDLFKAMLAHLLEMGNQVVGEEEARAHTWLAREYDKIISHQHGEGCGDDITLLTSTVVVPLFLDELDNRPPTGDLIIAAQSGSVRLAAQAAQDGPSTSTNPPPSKGKRSASAAQGGGNPGNAGGKAAKQPKKPADAGPSSSTSPPPEPAPLPLFIAFLQALLQKTPEEQAELMKKLGQL